MPELPEVETIARALRAGGRGHQGVVGARVARVEVLWPKSIAEPDAAAFAQGLRGAVLAHVGRRGKFLVLAWRTAGFLLVHLRMSGDLVVLERGDPLPRHTRWALYFDDGRALAFDNPRKFGRAWWVDDPQWVLGRLGPEPLDPALTPEIFYRRLQKHRRGIKPLLMEQTFLAGLGNIYTDEALHRARIHPQTPAHCLTPTQAERLLTAIRTVLRAGIAANGASIDWMYRGGAFQNTFRVYHRQGEPCPVCGTPIARIRMGGRSTHYCPQCQPLQRCDDGEIGD